MRCDIISLNIKIKNVGNIILLTRSGGYGTMKEIYKKIKTPYKYGAVVKFEDSFTDSPTVFRYNNKWYMYYVRISKSCESSGYETHFSSSDDLLNWKYEGRILKRNSGENWDSKQCGGYAAFPDITFGGTNELEKVNGKYYIAYIGGNNDGYEPDPLQLGMAYTDNPTDAGGYKRLGNPVLSPLDADAREFERKTIFKPCMFEDKKRSLGYKYVNVYNSRAADLKERVYLAVSDDGVNWKRYGDKPIIDETKTVDNLKISGDPQIVMIGDTYVMFYFKAIAYGPAYNTFAVSKNLSDWQLWDGEPLVKSEREWENVFAHKSYVLKYQNVVYHFYCAVNDKNERFIALATSKKLK